MSSADFFFQNQLFQKQNFQEHRQVVKMFVRSWSGSIVCKMLSADNKSCWERLSVPQTECDFA